MLKKEAAAVDLALWERNPVTLGVALHPFKLNIKAVSSRSRGTDFIDHQDSRLKTINLGEWV